MNRDSDDSLMRDRSIDLKDVEMYEGGGRKSNNIEINDNKMHIDIDRKKSMTPQNRSPHSIDSSEGENVGFNERQSDSGNLRVKMETSKHITFLKNNKNYDGQFYYIDQDKEDNQVDSNNSYDSPKVKNSSSRQHA